MTSRIRPAKRSEAKPIIGIYSESGRGKTYSSLLLARGFVGKAGRICMIETESGRGESYADPSEYPEIGGYDVLPLRDNFSPEEYGKAIKEVEAGGYDALIVDSASHEWEGSGGVLDMAAKNQASGKKGPIVWQQPKIDHQRHFMLKFMQTPISLVILNMRAKYPMEETERNGKKEWTRSKVLEPKQSEDILYEMFVHGWIDENHDFHMTKCTSKYLAPVFADEARYGIVDGVEQMVNCKPKKITLETGRRMREWASGLSMSNEQATLKSLANQIAISLRGSTSEDDAIRTWEQNRETLEKIKAQSQVGYDSLLKIFREKAPGYAMDHKQDAPPHAQKQQTAALTEPEKQESVFQCQICGDTGYIDEESDGQTWQEPCPGCGGATASDQKTDQSALF